MPALGRPRVAALVREALAAAGFDGDGAPSPHPVHTRTVVLWQADGGKGHDMAFMYRPVMDTLVNGFSHLPSEVASVIGQLKVVSGHGVSRLSAAISRSNVAAGDLLLWIGPIGSEAVPWKRLRQRGVRTIYYQTEPVNGCALSRSQPDEFWDFSFHNLDACPSHRPPWLPHTISRRYVPLGYVPPPAEAMGEARGETVEQLQSPALLSGADLLFFGYPFYKSGRKRCASSSRPAPSVHDLCSRAPLTLSPLPVAPRLAPRWQVLRATPGSARRPDQRHVVGVVYASV